jgi:hypothetical protein
VAHLSFSCDSVLGNEGGELRDGFVAIGESVVALRIAAPDAAVSDDTQADLAFSVTRPKGACQTKCLPKEKK